MIPYRTQIRRTKFWTDKTFRRTKLSTLWRTTSLIIIILKKKIKILKVLIYKKIIKTACTRSLKRYFKKCVRRSRLITKTIIWDLSYVRVALKQKTILKCLMRLLGRTSSLTTKNNSKMSYETSRTYEECHKKRF